jgi:hypothetical protein
MDGLDGVNSADLRESGENAWQANQLWGTLAKSLLAPFR